MWMVCCFAWQDRPVSCMCSGLCLISFPLFYHGQETAQRGPFTKYVDKILAFFDHLPPCVDIFYGMDIDKKWTFLDYLPTSSCKHSLWTTPCGITFLYCSPIFSPFGHGVQFVFLRRTPTFGWLHFFVDLFSLDSFLLYVTVRYSPDGFT